MRALLPCLLAALCCARVPPASAQPAADARAFDGGWMVTLACDGAADGARGYRWVFPATVANGSFRGLYGVQDAPSSVALNGTIAPDGSATFQALGHTGNPAASTGRVGAGTPFQFRAVGRFTATHGAGRRLGPRACSLDFVRQ